jgi:hypothetical protein
MSLVLPGTTCKVSKQGNSLGCNSWPTAATKRKSEKHRQQGFVKHDDWSHISLPAVAENLQLMLVCLASP